MCAQRNKIFENSVLTCTLSIEYENGNKGYTLILIGEGGQ